MNAIWQWMRFIWASFRQFEKWDVDETLKRNIFRLVRLLRLIQSLTLSTPQLSPNPCDPLFLRNNGPMSTTPSHKMIFSSKIQVIWIQLNCRTCMFSIRGWASIVFYISTLMELASDCSFIWVWKCGSWASRRWRFSPRRCRRIYRGSRRSSSTNRSRSRHAQRAARWACTAL